MPSATYEITLDTARDFTFTADISTYIRRMEWANGLAESYDEIALSAPMTLIIDNSDGAFWPEKSGATYAGLKKGTLVRVRASFSAIVNRTLYIGKILTITPTPGVYGDKAVTLTCGDFELPRADFSPALQTNVTVDAALTALFDSGVTAYPYARSFWLLDVGVLGTDTILFDSSGFTDFDTARSSLAYVGDNFGREESVSAGDFIRAMVAAEAGGRFFYDARTMQYIFHNRSRDIENETILASLDANDMESADYRYADDVLNHVTLHYQPRRVGTPLSVLWSLDNVPLRFAPGQERRISAHYTDPDNPSAQVGGQDMLTPVIGTDCSANTHASGSGQDAGRYLILSSILNAASAEFTLTNTAPFEIFVTLLRVRGTPLISYDDQFVATSNIESIRDADTRRRVIDVGAMSSDEDAAEYARYFVTRFQNPIGRFASLTSIINKTGGRMNAVLNATIGSRISITESGSAHDSDYIIVGERHTVIAGGEHTHTITWILKPVSRETFWVLGISGKSELGTTSNLAF